MAEKIKQYEAKDWAGGDEITAEALDNIESGIAALNSTIRAAETPT